MTAEPLEPALRRRRCYLVRHGAVDYFLPDGTPLDPRQVPLSELGVQQVRHLAEVLATIEFDRALCSDYPRARQTAELLLGTRSVALEETPALREVRAGRLRDIPPGQRRQRLCQAYDSCADRDGRFLGGERWTEFEARVLSCFHGLLDAPDWDRLLIVSHDAVNRTLLGWAIGCGIGGAAALEQDNACLNVIDLDMQGDRVVRRLVRTLNFTPYDPPKNDLQHTVMERVHAAYVGGAPIPALPANETSHELQPVR